MMRVPVVAMQGGSMPITNMGWKCSFKMVGFSYRSGFARNLKEV